MNLLDRIQQVALTLQPIRIYLWFLLASTVAVFIYAVTENASGRSTEQLGLLGTTWAILLLTLTYGFSQVPSAQVKGFWRKIGRRIHRGAYYLVALLTLGATIVLILFCIRLLMLANG